MLYYTLPGDTLSSIVGRHWVAIAAPTVDLAAEWVAYRNPELLRAGGPTAGQAYYIDAYQAGAVVYA